MKFMLVMYACSIIAGQCGEGIQDPVSYSSHKQCAVSGYKKAIEILNTMGEATVNDAKVFFSFTCTQANYS